MLLCAGYSPCVAQATVQDAEARSCGIKGAIELAAAFAKAEKEAFLQSVFASHGDVSVPETSPDAQVQVSGGAFTDATRQLLTDMKRQAEVAVWLEKCRLEEIASAVRRVSQKLRAAFDSGNTTHVLCHSERTRRALSALKDARALPRIVFAPSDADSGTDGTSKDASVASSDGAGGHAPNNEEKGKGKEEEEEEEAVVLEKEGLEKGEEAGLVKANAVNEEDSEEAAVCAAGGNVVSTCDKRLHLEDPTHPAIDSSEDRARVQAADQDATTSKGERCGRADGARALSPTSAFNRRDRRGST